VRPEQKKRASSKSLPRTQLVLLGRGKKRDLPGGGGGKKGVRSGDLSRDHAGLCVELGSGRGKKGKSRLDRDRLPRQREIGTSQASPIASRRRKRKRKKKEKKPSTSLATARTRRGGRAQRVGEAVARRHASFRTALSEGKGGKKEEIPPFCDCSLVAGRRQRKRKGTTSSAGFSVTKRRSAVRHSLTRKGKAAPAARSCLPGEKKKGEESESERRRRSTSALLCLEGRKKKEKKGKLRPTAAV